MDNPATLTTLGTKGAGRIQTKQKNIKYKTRQETKKRRSNTDLRKKNGHELMCSPKVGISCFS
jgi:hypothetical protein